MLKLTVTPMTSPTLSHSTVKKQSPLIHAKLFHRNQETLYSKQNCLAVKARDKEIESHTCTGKKVVYAEITIFCIVFFLGAHAAS